MLTPTSLSELLMAASLSIVPATTTSAADVQSAMKTSQASQTVSYEVLEKEKVSDMTCCGIHCSLTTCCGGHCTLDE